MIMKSLITLISLLVYTLPINVETSPFVLEANESKLTVSGTSTLHPWEIELEDMSCKANIEIQANLVQLFELSFEAKAESLKSEHGRLMDKKTHKALKSEEYPKIIFTLKAPQELTLVNGSYSGVVKGELYMAGFRRDINLKLSGTLENNILSLNGEKSLLMTDYKMDPPTALMGTVKTGNEVVIHYAIKLKSK